MGLVTTRVNEAQQVARRDRRCPIVAEGMKVERIELQHLPIENDLYAQRAIVHERERRDGTRRHAEYVNEQFGRSERKAPRIELLRESIEVNANVLPQDNQPEPAFPVLEKEVLCVGACNCATQGSGLLDRERLGMLMRSPGDTKLLQAGVERGFAFVGGSNACGWIHGTRRLIHSGSTNAEAWISGL